MVVDVLAHAKEALLGFCLLRDGTMILFTALLFTAVKPDRLSEGATEVFFKVVFADEHTVFFKVVLHTVFFKVVFAEEHTVIFKVVLHGVLDEISPEGVVEAKVDVVGPKEPQEFLQEVVVKTTLAEVVIKVQTEEVVVVVAHTLATRNEVMESSHISPTCLCNPLQSFLQSSTVAVAFFFKPRRKGGLSSIGGARGLSARFFSAKFLTTSLSFLPPEVCLLITPEGDLLLDEKDGEKEEEE